MVLSVRASACVVLDTFEPVPSPILQELNGHLKSSGSPNDVVLPRQISFFPTLGAFTLNFNNHSLSFGVVPKHFKHATLKNWIEFLNS